MSHESLAEILADGDLDPEGDNARGSSHGARGI